MITMTLMNDNKVSEYDDYDDVIINDVDCDASCEYLAVNTEGTLPLLAQVREGVVTIGVT